MKNKNEKWVNLLILFASLMITILVVELSIFFIFDIKPPSYEAERFFQFSMLTGYIHKPNSRGYWYRYRDGTKHYVTMNEFGFSDSRRSIKKERPRIALLGDSTTEFWEVDTPYRGQYVIERLLNNKIEVLNFGVRGYGTDQTYILFKNEGIHFSPDIVIYTFCINDLNDNVDSYGPYFSIDPKSDRLILNGYPLKYRDDPPPDPSLWKRIKAFLREDSFFYRHLMYIASDLKGTVKPLEQHFELRPFKKEYNDDDHFRMELTLRIISELDQFVKSHSMKFLVVEGLYKPVLDEKMKKKIIKSYGDIFDFEKPTQKLQDYFQEKNIEFLSLPKIVKEQNIPVEILFHREDNMHLNERGIELFSDSVVRKLRSLGWVPSSHNT